MKTLKCELTAEIWRERLPLLDAEETLFPQHGDLGADGFCDVADVEQCEFLQTLHLRFQLRETM